MQSEYESVGESPQGSRTRFQCQSSRAIDSGPQLGGKDSKTPTTYVDESEIPSSQDKVVDAEINR